MFLEKVGKPHLRRWQFLPEANLTIYQKGIYYSGIKNFNSLPLEIWGGVVVKALRY
jgi:hypothetical protein